MDIIEFLYQYQIDIDSNKSRGFGFVQFAIPEDAERARDHCMSTQFLNSNLQVEFAMHRQREANKRQHELIESEEKKPEPSKRRHVKPLWERVLLVSGLGEGLERKHLFKKLSKFGHVCAISFPAVIPVSSRIDIPGNLDMLAAEEKKNNKKMNMTELLRNNDVADCVELSDAAHVFFLNAQHAQTACEKLNNHIFKGQKLSAAICPNPIEAKLSSRIVLRNIPFDCPPSKIYKAFSKYGHIIEINLPKGKEDKGRGFGFLTFSSRQQAASAIESATKTDLGRTVVADWAVPKNEYASEKRVENLVGEVTEEVAEEANEGTIEEAVEDTIEETIEEAVEEPEDETESLEESSKEESALSSEDAVNEKNRVHNNVKQQRESDVSEGKTLFIKNIPFEATEEELIEL